MKEEPEIYGCLVTHDRPDWLRQSLQAIQQQTRRLDAVWLIDNAPSDASEQIISTFGGDLPLVHRRASRNLGPAGARAWAMTEIYEAARDNDWLLMLDDDDPIPTPDLVENLLQISREVAARDAVLAGVALRGASFDPKRVSLHVPLQSRGPTRVDYLHGNHFPFYLIGPSRSVGVFDSSLFFGFEELDYGLRLRREGFNLYMLPELLRQSGMLQRHSVIRQRPRLGLDNWEPRRYYSLRNMIIILRKLGLFWPAVRYTSVVGLGKPIANLPLSPTRAVQHLTKNVKAVKAGWKAAIDTGHTLVER